MIDQKKVEEVLASRKPPSMTDKIESLLKELAHPSAYQYLQQIRKNNPNAYNYIRDQLFPSQILSEIDLLMTYLSRGLIRKGVISLTEIQYLERKALGIESTITVKRQGQDATSLSNYLKEE